MNDREYKCLLSSNYNVMPDTISYTEGVKFGLRWADENPKEGLVSIDKVCEWIEEHMNEFCMEAAEHSMISWLRKVMEE